MLKVMSDIMEHCYDMQNTVNNSSNQFLALIYFNAKKMIGALIIIISNDYGIKCLRNVLQLEPFNDMFKVFSDIMLYCYVMYNTITVAINLLH